MFRQLEASGSIVNGSVLDEWRKAAEAAWPQELERIQMASRLSGKPVVYNLSMFELNWSPVFICSENEPIAWVRHDSGEVHDGAMPPKDLG